MLKKLIKIANHLDKSHLTEEANFLDQIISKLAGEVLTGDERSKHLAYYDPELFFKQLEVGDWSLIDEELAVDSLIEEDPTKFFTLAPRGMPLEDSHPDEAYYAAGRVAEVDPRAFFELGLDKRYPELKIDAETNLEMQKIADDMFDEAMEEEEYGSEEGM